MHQVSRNWRKLRYEILVLNSAKTQSANLAEIQPRSEETNLLLHVETEHFYVFFVSKFYEIELRINKNISYEVDKDCMRGNARTVSLSFDLTKIAGIFRPKSPLN